MVGFKQISIDGSHVNISEPEKTIVDCLDRLRYCGGISEVAKALWYGRDEFDFTKMAEYSRRYGNRAANQRLGYLIELLGFKADKAVEILLQSKSTRYTPDIIDPYYDQALTQKTNTSISAAAVAHLEKVQLSLIQKKQ